MTTHHHINYVELPCKDLAKTKVFFAKVFGWKFKDYSDSYAAFEQSGLDGGFYSSNDSSSTKQGAALVVLYSLDLEATQAAVLEASGEICENIFEFPGGRRFHFIEPSGNELAVWSDK